MARPDVEITLNGLARWQTAISGMGPNVRAALASWTRIYGAFIRKRFVIFSRGGGNWRRLKPATIARRRNHSDVILRDTNLLFSHLVPQILSIKPATKPVVQFKFGGRASYPDGVTVTDVMGFHQRGAGNLPVRKIFVQPDPKTQKQMTAVMKEGARKDAKPLDAINPFTLCYDEIVKAFSDYGLRVTSWNSTRDPEKDTVQAADLPTTDVRASGIQVTLGSTSGTTDVKQNYDVGFNTGDQRIGYLFFPVSWLVIQALHQLKYDLLGELRWQGKPFVQDVIIAGGIQGLSDPERSAGMEGWSGAMTITVFMEFARGDMML